ncbi:hypothetical protein BU14_0482s0013 [Porphyra umbilicalis]|uniref:Uncharacterized protein n=1 Tax=Porphyra umbilicalis TaxID=2786 RepID=A0A1X6NU37_PORUM|nr:hypothetical protein BU14_0482s0013 [Porphyra umbilicalis]|eukprot:OSX72020.1 hypothetical protein BU14_0482s0013 [Porphyra umbilicalis]
MIGHNGAWEGVGTDRGGWTRAGVAAVPAGERSRWGVPDVMALPPLASVYCRGVPAGVLSLGMVGARGGGAMPGFEDAPGGYDVLLGEADGSAPTPPRQAAELGGKPALPGRPCPRSLHDLWVVPNADGADADTRGRAWATWHPQLDPIYYCTYGHEHGSAPGRVAGLAPPPFGLVAWKNGREDESHVGFKGYAFAVNGVSYYLTVHVDTTSLRRVHARTHTVSLTAVDAAGATALDVRCKGDFGFSFALPADFQTNFRFLPAGPAEAALHDAAEADPERQPIHHSRRINVVNPGRPDIDAADLPVGRYEEWRGGYGFCTTSRESNAGFTIDVKDPITACRTLACPSHEEPAQLAPDIDIPRAVFVPSRGLRRDLIFDGMSVGRHACRDAVGDGDVWYTNAACTRVLPGPAPNAVRQVASAAWGGGCSTGSSRQRTAGVAGTRPSRARRRTGGLRASTGGSGGTTRPGQDRRKQPCWGGGGGWERVGAGAGGWTALEGRKLGHGVHFGQRAAVRHGSRQHGGGQDGHRPIQQAT